MAAGYDGSIRIDTKINTKSFNAGIAGMTQSLKGLAGALGLAVGVAALARIGKQAISLASDIEEVQNVVDTAFGSMSNKMEEFAETSIEQFGMSKLVAKQMGSTYMAMGRGMGLGMEEGADMAIGATARIGDVASFYNKSFEEVDTMMKSIWTGETESLKRIGVVMTETNLQAFALSQGIQKNVSDMTQAEKTQLRYAFVMDQTKLAAGDFAKTSGSWANQTRILSEQWKEFLSVIGTGMIQILTPALQFLNKLMAVLTSFAQKFSSVTAALFGKQTLETESATTATNALSDAQDTLAKNTEKASKAAKGATTNFDTLHVMTSSESSTASVAPIDTGAMAALGPVQIDAEVGENTEISPKVQSAINRLKAMFEPLKNIDFTNLQNSLGTLWDSISNLGGTVWDGIEWAYYNILVPLAKWTVEDLLPAFFNLLSGAADVLSSALKALKPLWEWLWDNMLQPIAEWTGGVIVSIINGLADAFTRISDWIDNHQTAFQDIVLIISSMAAAFLAWKAAIWLAHAAQKAYAVIQGIVNGVMNANPIGLIVLAIGALIGIIILCIKHWDDIKAAAGRAVDWIKKKWAAIGEWFKTKVVQPIKNVFSGIKEWFQQKFKAAYDAIKAVFGTIGNWFGEKYQAIKNVFKNIGTWFGEKFDTIKLKFMSAFNSIKQFFKDCINGWISNIESFVNFFINGINVIIRGINKIQIKTPDWLGGKSIGFNIKELTKISIPRLATGAVIPPRSEFLAVLGDQKRGTNIEAPEGLIRKIIREEMGSQGGGDWHIYLIRQDGTVESETIITAAQRKNRKAGKTIIPVGV